MRTTLHKNILILLTLAVATTANAQSGNCGSPNAEDVQWSYDATTTTLTITGTGAIANYAKSNNIPWNSYRGAMTKIIVSEGITAIGQNNFYECKKVTSITLPSTLKSIGTQAFINNTAAAQDLVIPEGVTTIADKAFEGCNAVLSVTLPSTLESLGTNSIRVKRSGVKIPFTFKSNPTMQSSSLYSGNYTATLALDDAQKPFFAATSANTFNGGASYKRTTTSKCEPIVLPFVPTSGMDGCKFYELKSATASELTFEEATTIEAGKPYIMVAEPGEYTFSTESSTTIAANATASSVTVEPWTMYGTYSSTEQEAYGFQGAKLTKDASPSEYSPFSIYFVSSSTESPDEVNVIIDGVTSVNTIEVNQFSVNEIYNLKGQRIPSISKGINIIKGTDGSVRKVIQK